MAVAEPGGAILRVAGLTRSFGPVVALQPLSFEARAGEIVGLLGPNGAGKTTAIRLLSTILSPTAGGFTLNGVPHTQSAAIRRQIGVLPESAGYPLHLTGAGFLRYHARLFGYDAAAAHAVAASLLAEVGLAERGAARIGTYSRGMRQRLGVARALVNTPQLILLDEPTLGLDPAGQRQMLALIRAVAAERGATVLISTHFLDEVEEVCSRVIILHRGAVVAAGSLAEIQRQAAPRAARVRVRPEVAATALAVMQQAAGVLAAAADDPAGGWLRARFDPAWLDGRGDAAMNSVIGALCGANIPVLAYAQEGGRLSDAFFALTGEGSA